MGMVLLGGFLGFWVAVIGYVAFGLPMLAALAIWAGAGPIGAVLALLRMPQAEVAETAGPSTDGPQVA